MTELKSIKIILKESADPSKAKILQRFFKTGKGEYGEGDVFLGITVPIQREIAKKYFDKINYDDTTNLLKSKIHEERMTALFLLLEKYKKFPQEREKIFSIYIDNVKWINNWDLIDLTAPNIVGNYLMDKNKKLLYDFANSNDLWKKRISIVSTFYFIKNYEFEHTIKISEILLNDKNDLIHKAVGWMLREIGKRDEKILESFLKKYYKKMPRTMLRYAIEKFEENKRLKYLKGKIK